MEIFVHGLRTDKRKGERVGAQTQLTKFTNAAVSTTITSKKSVPMKDCILES